jgi:hypothetical protein
MRVHVRVLPVLLLAAAAPAGARESKPWVNVLCKFADSASMEPQPQSYFDGLLGHALPAPAFPTLDHYFRAVSYDQVDLAGSLTTRWLTLAHPLDFYRRSETGEVPGNGYLNRTQLYTDCARAAEGEVHLPDFYGINVMMNIDVGRWSPHRPTLTLNGVTRDWGVTVLGSLSYTQHTVVAHEMLHGFDVGHSGTFLDNGRNGEGNYWDVVSSPPGGTTDPTYGVIGPHPIAHHKYRLGWLSGHAFETPTTANECWNVRIDRLSHPSPVNYLMARVPYGGSGLYYTLEARSGVGADDYDSVLGAPEALVVHHVDEQRDEKALVVDEDDNGDVGDAGARFTPGEHFEVPDQFRVNVISSDPDGVDVRILRPPAVPTGVRAGSVPDQGIEVSWSGHAPCSEEGQIQVATECPPGDESCVDETLEDRVPPTPNRWLHRGVEPGTAYRYRVRMCLGRDEGCSAWSEWSPRVVFDGSK